jgi:hypothetical protein
MKEGILIRFVNKSFFRISDRIELSIMYMFCFFLSIIFEFGENFKTDSYILMIFIKNFTDYKVEINLLLTIIVVLFHYQILNRKKIEIYCRILVGDILSKITIRYIFECLLIMIVSYFISMFIKLCCNLNLYNDIYLVGVFVLYILISASQVRKYENF